MKTHRALLGRVTEADLRLLRVFVAITEANGIAAAELTLNISRSVISRHLKSLESRLGVCLCQRGPGGFSLTDEGKTVLAAARRLIGQIDTFRSEIAELHNEFRGDLQIAVFDKFFTNPACQLSQAIAEFGTRAPAVRIHLHVESGGGIEQGILDGRFHLGIQPFHRASEALSSFALFGETMHLYCATQHALARVSDISEDEIRRADFVGLTFHSQNMETYWRLGLEPAARASDQEGSLALIASGRYIGFLPDHYAHQFEQSGEITRLRHEAFRYHCDWHAMVRRTPPPGRMCDAFLTCLKALHHTG
jgi:DNA-binding transcriptional LysR family regulator